MSSSLSTVTTRQIDGFLLDQAAPVLVVMFLLVAATSGFLQMTSTRAESLASSEKSLVVSAELATMDFNAHVLAGVSALQAIIALPKAVRQPGRQFVAISPNNDIVAAHPIAIGIGQPADRLFASGLDFAQIRKSSELHRVMLAEGELASVVILPLSATGGVLITYERVTMELAAWRKHAGEIGTILLCFGAVTIAFTLVFYSQRAKVRLAGHDAGAQRTRFELALERGNCGLWDHVLGADSTSWSHSMENILGYGSDDGNIERSRIDAAMHPDDASPLVLAEALQAEGGNEFDHLFRIRHADGHWIWLKMRASIVQNQGTPPRLLGIVMDVTEEHHAEMESHRADLRLRDAIESISELFVLWDETNRLVLCNSKYQAFHQLPPHLVQRGTPYRDLIKTVHEPRMMIEIERGTDMPDGARAYEAQFQDGRWLQISERPTKDGGFVSVGTDITARKTQEERLFDNERQLRMTISDLASSREALRKQAVQMAELADRYLEQKAEAVSANRAKAEFLANMNHEIRTPLNAIIGFSEIIEGEVLGEDARLKYCEYAGNIRQSGINLLAIINDVLDMAHIEAGRVGLVHEAQPIGILLEQAMAQVAVDARSKRVSIEIEPDPTLPMGKKTIQVDANAIGQALRHLMCNAVRLSPIGGRVSLRARLQGESINIFIADAGCMLTADEIGTLHVPFGHIDGMLENGCKGSGLGVAIAKSLVELHGGTLRMRSSPRIGSMVMIHLPVAQLPVQLSLPMSTILAA